MSTCAVRMHALAPRDRRLAVLLMAVTAAGLAPAAAQAGASARAAVPEVALRLSVTETPGATPRIATLDCRGSREVAGGYLAEAPVEACKQARSVAELLLSPSEPDGVCTAILGGEQTAEVTGFVDGRSVQRAFSRRGGCAIADWDRMGLLLSSAQTTTLDTLARDTPVDTDAGVTVWSRFDPAIGAFRLVVNRAGINSTPAIAPNPVAFDADAGPGPDGGPVVVYSRCDAYDAIQRPVGDCDLFLLDLDSGAERRLTGANSSVRELHPTVWRDQLAWVRASAPNRVVVYRRALSDPRTKRSTRTAGVPTRRCADRDARQRHVVCPQTVDRMVSDLQLRAGRLAQIVTYHGPRLAGFRHNEVRLVLLRTGEVRRVASTVTGLSGQTFLGLSYDARHLAWFKTCLADGCASGAGAFRYRVSTRRLEYARDRAQLAGWAWTPGTTYQVADTLDPGDCSAQCPLTITSVVRTGEPDWKALPARR